MIEKALTWVRAVPPLFPEMRERRQREGLARLLDSLRTYRVDWDRQPREGYSALDDREPASLEGANVASSELRQTFPGSATGEFLLDPPHIVALDLDVPAYLIPSSTEGHSHLYIDVRMPWSKYAKLLDALADAGVIEPGYAEVSKEREHTALRLPWEKKPAPVAPPVDEDVAL